MALDVAVRQAFERALSPADVLSDRVQCRAYECDGLTGYRVVPELVLLPRDAEQVAAAVRVCHKHGVPFVARGAGTGLSGGALPVAEGVVISLSRLTRILSVDAVDRRAVVEPGVTNLAITKAAAPLGLYYAPDPSSQQVCTIGGNVAENSGGAHCLKYGFTTHHVLSAEVVLPDGEVVTVGADTGEQAGPDLRGVMLGSEGTLGIVTRVTVRLLRVPESVRTLLADFPSIAAAGDVVSDIIAAGIVPAAVEMMDTLAIEAAEEAVHAGYTVGVAAAAGEGDLRQARLHPPAHRWLRRRAGGDLAGAEGGVRGCRPDLPRLLRAGRRCAPHPPGRGARPDRGDGRRGRAPGG
jgi:glycolate oxidase